MDDITENLVTEYSTYTRNGPAQARVKDIYLAYDRNVLSSAEHGRCPHKY